MREIECRNWTCIPTEGDERSVRTPIPEPCMICHTSATEGLAIFAKPDPQPGPQNRLGVMIGVVCDNCATTVHSWIECGQWSREAFEEHK